MGFEAGSRCPEAISAGCIQPGLRATVHLGEEMAIASSVKARHEFPLGAVGHNPVTAVTEA
jgi:hypothetical protein